MYFTTSTFKVNTHPPARGFLVLCHVFENSFHHLLFQVPNTDQQVQLDESSQLRENIVSDLTISTTLQPIEVLAKIYYDENMVSVRQLSTNSLFLLFPWNLLFSHYPIFYLDRVNIFHDVRLTVRRRSNNILFKIIVFRQTFFPCGSGGGFSDNHEEFG